MVMLGDRHYELGVTGSTEPVIILGGRNAAVASLSRLGTVVTYSHAGFGSSDPAAGPRSTSANVDDLRQALAITGLKAPYVLVGHSAWAFDVLYLASKWPEEVSALVLVDPSVTHMDRKLFPHSPTLEADETATRNAMVSELAVSVAGDDAVRSERLRCQLSEWDCFTSLSSDEVEGALCDLGDQLVIVLSANELAMPPNASTAEHASLLPIWKREHDRYARLSRKGRCFDAPGGHDVGVRTITAAVRLAICQFKLP